MLGIGLALQGFWGSLRGAAGPLGGLESKLCESWHLTGLLCNLTAVAYPVHGIQQGSPVLSEGTCRRGRQERDRPR